jgi:hypothetical protein
MKNKNLQAGCLIFLLSLAVISGKESGAAAGEVSFKAPASGARLSYDAGYSKAEAAKSDDMPTNM